MYYVIKMILKMNTISQLFVQYIQISENNTYKNYYVRPSVIKFITLMNSTNRKTLNNLALYIIKAFQLRNSLMNEFT